MAAADPQHFCGIEAATGQSTEPDYAVSALADVDATCAAAAAAFDIYRETNAETRAAFLDAIGAEIMAIGNALLDRAARESGLPAMVHGGPYPATSDGRSTSVGTLAIDSCARSTRTCPTCCCRPSCVRAPTGRGWSTENRLDGPRRRLIVRQIRREESWVPSTAAYIAVDWGTTNRRATLMGDDGAVLHGFVDHRGVLSLAREQYPVELTLIRDRLDYPLGDRPIVAAGMIGSARGCHDVTCVDAPADLAALARAGWRDETQVVTIVPGVAQRQPHADVMRGEEEKTR